MRASHRLARRLAVILIVLIGVAVVFASKGCSTTIPNRDPTGETFPSVVGQSLEKDPLALPEDLAGAPAVLLIGYDQGAQFDIDRWLMGLMQSRMDVRLFEVPTIPGLLPTIASGWIDDGMRSGIPREDWGAVVTLYGSAAEPVAAFTGTERGRLTRVVVLDGQGRVIWFDDEGFSARKAVELAERLGTSSAGG